MQLFCSRSIAGQLKNCRHIGQVRQFLRLTKTHMKINFVTFKYMHINIFETNLPKTDPMLNQDKMENLKEEEPYGLGCALESFTEKEEVLKFIENLKNVVNSDRSVYEKAYERFLFIFSLYSEQPHLLDKHIPELLEKFMEIIRNSNNSIELKHMTFKYLFVLVNVRGYKVIVNDFPHEVSDLKPVLEFLENENPDDCDNWTTRYILLLWLSIIVMIPFDMSRFDGSSDLQPATTTMDRILNLVKIYAIASDKCRDAAAYLSARFLTRYDVKQVHLASFFEWVKELSLKESYNIFLKHGTMSCVAMILKYGKREDLVPYARNLLQWIINSKFKTNTGTNVNKSVLKIVQRLGLTLLPPQIAKWRYRRGNRSLAANLSAGDGSAHKKNDIDEKEENDADNDVEVPEEIEEIIDQLIQGLRHSDGVVRWSAAKGVGRVTGRLPKELADEVVGSILHLFNPREGDGAWHGGCLALAELGRRGLLLPQRLPEVVPVVLKALVYDEPRGYSSVGSHIRDAACYVCWSFARAYETHVLEPFVDQIASMLLVVTCFDREINCRRAASAAFQENVGRQGTFPHGISIITCADFFAVSVRNNAYLQIAPYVAQFEEYAVPLVSHLVERKVDHWDPVMRELTASALHNLTSANPNYLAETVMPTLLEMAYSLNLNARHGAVLTIGEIVHAFSIISKNDNVNLNVFINDDLLEKMKMLMKTCRERFYFRGMGGELMRQAFCDFIKKCSLARIPYHNDDVIDDWLSLVNECIPYDVINVRERAVEALPVLLEEYYRDDSKKNKQTSIISEYIKQLLGVNLQVHRMGHASALGALPLFMLKNDLENVIESLVEACSITSVTAKWAEARRDSVKALSNIITTLGEDLKKDVPEQLVDNIYKTFLEGLKDYSQDKRGDIGAWMREASMMGIQTLFLHLSDHCPAYLKKEMVVQALSNIAQQAVEKIDRTRALAGKVFYNLIYHENLLCVPYHEDLMIIFPKDECDNLNWNSASCTFPKFVQVLKYPEFTYNILLGLICSVGGMTETLVKYASSSLFTYLKFERNRRGVEEIGRICDVIHEIFSNHRKNDRIVVPMFRFLDKLFESGCIDCVIHDTNLEFAGKILKLVQMEMSGCRDIYKLMDGANALCQFIPIKSEVCDTALVQLNIMLCHRQTYIRRATATRLYETLLVNGDNSNINPEKLEEILQLLSNTNWEEPVEVVKPIRNELCKLMGVRVPTPKVKSPLKND